MSDESTPSLGSTQVIAGRYEVMGLLGVGGMGAVYKVLDRELDEVVALKMLKREIAGSPGIVDRFRREVKLARRVTHPNVARTFDLGEHEGERFLTMEYVEGESLATRIAREGKLPITDVVDIVTAICAGLEAAHAAGVVHRDLKPDNVLLGHDRVVITDFGIARAQDPGAVSRTAVPLGTPAYMAPEQVEASPNVDARADIYALGAMMYEILTGRLPFEADSVFAVAAMRLTQPPPDPRVHRHDLPDSLAQLVQKCMARKPEDRPQRAAEIASRLASTTLPATDLLAGTNAARVVSISPSRDQDVSQKTVAVLPFRNAGPPEDDYLVDGLTDDLIDALSMTPGLRVRPRGLVMMHKNATDPREIGRELGVQVVVEGTVRPTADAMRVSARVLSVEDGFQIWAKRFDGKRSDVLRIGDDAAKEVSAALAVRTPTRAAMTTDPVALDLYLRGRHEYFKFWATANERATELLKAAHDRAPHDALIMAGYASALARQFGTSNAVDRSANARAVAEQAVRLAPQLAEAHVALATVKLQDPDPVAVASGIVRALSLSPVLADAHELRARLLSEIAPPRETIEAAERAMQLEPRITHLRFDVQARSRAILGEWDLDEYAAPNDVDTANIYWVMAVRYTMWSRNDTAAEKIARTLAVNDTHSVLVRAFVGIVLDKKIPTSERERIAERKVAPSVTKRMRTFWHQISAEVLSYVGEDAMDDVRAAVDLGLFDITWMDGCPLLEDLRKRAEFEELRERVAARARPALMQLHGSDATIAS
jgi:eukaryotic-like serine/threonine-protein kinase